MSGVCVSVLSSLCPKEAQMLRSVSQARLWHPNSTGLMAQADREKVGLLDVGLATPLLLLKPT